MPDLLASLGWDADLDNCFVAHRPDCVPARVVRVDRGGAQVLATDGPHRITWGAAVLAAGADTSAGTRIATGSDRLADGAAASAAEGAAATLGTPCTGDWVALRHWPDGRTTAEALLPRRTAVTRMAAGRASVRQVLAANVDTVAVVEPLVPEPDLGRLERLLVLGWESGAQPVVVLTKTDLAPDAELVAADVARAAPGVEVHLVSSVQDGGAASLSAHAVAGRTLALLGPSGAGKSTLVNALAGTDVMAISRLRADGKGRHTTTHRELVLLPTGGVVVDTPGLRSVGLAGDAGGMAAAFPDVEELAAQCRFRDCRHESEPGCAVLAAVESGDLEARRLDAWHKLLREACYMQRRSDARLRAEERARWRRVTLDNRRHQRSRP